MKWLEESEAYYTACERAATQPAKFATFKQDPAYQAILEHCTAEQGQLYLDRILREFPWALGIIDQLTENDGVGDPMLVAYPGLQMPIAVRHDGPGPALPKRTTRPKSN